MPWTATYLPIILIGLSALYWLLSGWVWRHFRKR